MYLVDYAKYYKLKQGTRSEELVSTMRCLFIIIIIRAFWVIDGKERKRGRERGLQISSRRFLIVGIIECWLQVTGIFDIPRYTLQNCL